MDEAFRAARGRPRKCSMGEKYRIEIIPDGIEGGYVVSYPDLRGCVTTGETIEEAVANAEDAKREWLIAAMEDGYPKFENNG